MKELGARLEISITYNSGDTIVGRIFFLYPPTDEQSIEAIQKFNKIYGNKEGGIMDMCVKVEQFDVDEPYYFQEN